MPAVLTFKDVQEAVDEKRNGHRVVMTDEKDGVIHTICYGFEEAYVNSETIMKIECCDCGEIYKGSLNNFHDGNVNCKCWRNKIKKENSKIKYDNFKEKLSSERCKVDEGATIERRLRGISEVDRENKTKEYENGDKSLYIHKRSMMSIRCRNNHYFTLNKKKWDRGNRCPFISCREKMGINGESNEAKNFYDKAYKLYQKRYTYETCYVDEDTEITLLCNNHKIPFNILPADHLTSFGCHICFIYAVKNRYEMIKYEMCELYKDSYEINTPMEEINTHTSMNFYITVTHKPCNITNVKYLGDFLNAKTKTGCKDCSFDGRKLDMVEVISRFNDRWKFIYIYDEFEYFNNRTRGKIYCKKCNSYFWQAADNHFTNSGCYNCRATSGETDCKAAFEKLNVKYETQKPYGRLRFDFYLPEYSAFVEMDGQQHLNFIPYFHKTIENYNAACNRDRIKDNYCWGKYPLIRIRYDQQKNIDKIIEHFITELKFLKAGRNAFYKSIDVDGLNNYVDELKNNKTTRDKIITSGIADDKIYLTSWINIYTPILYRIGDMLMGKNINDENRITNINNENIVNKDDENRDIRRKRSSKKSTEIKIKPMKESKPVKEIKPIHKPKGCDERPYMDVVREKNREYDRAERYRKQYEADKHNNLYEKSFQQVDKNQPKKQHSNKEKYCLDNNIDEPYIENDEPMKCYPYEELFQQVNKNKNQLAKHQQNNVDKFKKDHRNNKNKKQLRKNYQSDKKIKKDHRRNKNTEKYNGPDKNTKK